MKLAITGHRPDKLDDIAGVYNALVEALGTLNPEYMYQGMAPGADLLAATAARVLGIPYEAVLPYAGHKSMVKGEFWEAQWELAVINAAKVTILNDSMTYPGHWCMHNRNRYMVDHADEVLAVWDGSMTGGTASTYKYARKKGKTIHTLDPVDLEFYHASEIA